MKLNKLPIGTYRYLAVMYVKDNTHTCDNCGKSIRNIVRMYCSNTSNYHLVGVECSKNFFDGPTIKRIDSQLKSEKNRLIRQAKIEEIKRQDELRRSVKRVRKKLVSPETQVVNPTTSKGFRAMQLKDKFKFGKYKGYTLKSIIEKDNNYINWCIKNDVITLHAHAEFYRNNGRELF